MTYFLLPQIEFNIRASNIKLSIKEKETLATINPSLRKYLSKIKGLIDENIDNWDNIKKYTNPYEFIHTTIPGHNFSVSKIKPISRAFFKLLEIYNTHDILTNSDPIKTFHLAEGPGGFIEATTYLRNNSQDHYYGMTLIKPNINIPGWNKADTLMRKYTNIIIEYGKDGTGDLYNHKNLEHCNHKYANSMDIITADGGFDFSIDFNNQERLAFRLIFTQVMYAITMQKYSGHFILKMFDIFEKSSIDILYLLSCFYDTVIITKPNTSRYANSEKYIVCKNFKFKNTNDITHKFIKVLKILETLNFNKYVMMSVINIPIQKYWLNYICESNSIFGQKQIDNILSTVKIITHKDRKNEKIQYFKTMNVQKCINWCIKNNIPYNKDYKTTNIFLSDRPHKIAT